MHAGQPGGCMPAYPPPYPDYYPPGVGVGVGGGPGSSVVVGGGAAGLAEQQRGGDGLAPLHPHHPHPHPLPPPPPAYMGSMSGPGGQFLSLSSSGVSAVPPPPPPPLPPSPAASVARATAPPPPPPPLVAVVRQPPPPSTSEIDPRFVMFSPPVGGNSGGGATMKGGPPNVDSSQIYHQGYKSGMNNGEAWNNSQPGGPPPPVRMYEGHPQYNGTSGGESIDHFLGPSGHDGHGMSGMMNKSPATDMYNRTSGFSSPAPQGMMGNAMPPMSPDMSAGKTTCAPYYNRGGRPGGDKFPPDNKRNRKGSSVYSPSPDDYGQDSPNRYTSPKPSVYGEYFMDPPHASQDHWSGSGGPQLTSAAYSSSIMPGGSHYSHSQSSYMHHPEMGYPHPVSPNQEAMLASGLPPMSTFRPPTSSAYSGSSPTANGSQPPSQQTGDALGKALASIYPTEQTSSSYGGSNPATPVSSPPPMSGTSQQWHRPSSQTATSPHYESHLHSLPPPRMDQPLDNPIHGPNKEDQTRMEERLDDAIHVLRNHAEGQMPGMPGLPPGHPGLPPAMMSAAHSNGIMGSVPPYPPLMSGPPHLEPHMGGSHPSSLGDRGVSQTSISSVPSEQKPPFDGAAHGDSSGDQGSGVKVEKGDNKGDGGEESSSASDSLNKVSKGAGSSAAPCASGGPPASKRARRAPTVSEYGDDDEKKEGDEDETPEAKAERERLRRQANNARERVRVRDINEAFKELGQMVTMHTNTSQPLTKLMVLQQAVNVITALEQQVRERNLNPKAACLKRREEEKTEELPGRALNSDDLASQSHLGSKCTPEPGKDVAPWW
ncbi:transcription factor 4-like isoform X2 [Babylonia areolata]|uniref:transcription factor 4-like isoform X2 n=1 Tax=Babylonia areolata TaxID=304850 RepID=UPI003FD20EEC